MAIAGCLRGESPARRAAVARVRGFVLLPAGLPGAPVSHQGRHPVKFLSAAVLFVLCQIPFAASAQTMNADDLKWVNQCINDNKGEPGATPAIVRAYCICMNEKMDNNESQSITQWEKSHPNERKACDKQSGWR